MQKLDKMKCIVCGKKAKVVSEYLIPSIEYPMCLEDLYRFEGFIMALNSLGRLNGKLPSESIVKNFNKFKETAKEWAAPERIDESGMVYIRLK